MDVPNSERNYKFFIWLENECPHDLFSLGPVATREDKIKAIVDDIMEKLPELFNMSEIMGKVEERTPYVVVAFQVKAEHNGDNYAGVHFIQVGHTPQNLLPKFWEAFSGIKFDKVVGRIGVV